MNKKIIRLRSTPTKHTKNNLLYMQEVGILPSESAGYTKRKQIDSYLIILVDKGKGFIEINNTEYIMNKGQCAFIDCKIEHSYKCDKNDPWEVKWLHFNGISAKYYFDLFSKESCCVFTPRLINVLNAKVCEIITNNAHKNNKTEIINANLITDILTAILTNEVIPENGEKSVNQMKSVKEYIDNHFTESINLDKISSEFYMNKYYITREFKKEYGETIFQHIIRRRIDYAKELLATTNKTIDEISHLCGFNDQCYFSRQFKKIEGISSLNYRKNNKNNI